MKKLRVLSLLLAFLLLLPSLSPYAIATDDYDGTLRIVDGAPQPMLNYSDGRADDYDNAKSDLPLC